MIRLTDHIAYLLTCHDCVIVPGWGAFIAHRSPAALVEATGELFPPGRHLSFNASIADTDGLLARSVSRREGMSYSRAVECVAGEVDTMRHQLDHDGELVIPRVGRFLSSADGSTPLFEPAPDAVANLAYSSLPAIGAPVEVAPSGHDDNQAGEKIAVVAAPGRRVPAFVRIAAALALLLGLGFMFSIPREPGGVSHTDYASMSPAARQAKPSVMVTDDINCLDELFIATPSDPDAAVSVERLEPAAPVAQPVPRYCVVVASLPSRGKALEFIARSGDSSLRLLESEGRFRVYAAGASTYAAAASEALSLRSRYSGAWVCRR